MQQVQQAQKGWAAQQRPGSPFEQQPPDFDPYGNPIVPAESKREKRRRDMVDRVSRLHADTLERRDRVFHDLSEIFARTADELLPPPVFPTFDLSIPVGQLPPSLPFTDPVIPDMHPTPYLFSLHRLSLQRANHHLAVRLHNAHQLAVARRLYEAEVERIEDEYEGATKGVVERLLESVEERRKRLTEEKEGEGVTLGAFLFWTLPKDRKLIIKRVEQTLSSTRKPNGDGKTPLDTAAIGSILGLTDPFNLASSFLPANANSVLNSLAGNGPTASLLAGVGGKRKPGPRAQPGLPPAHWIVTSGAYNQFGKSLAGLAALRNEEIDRDVADMRRKRARTGGASSSRRRANGE
ncbi:Sds3-like family protein [Pseudohyphozyma bogoriensis]|nr:Sds3-like family protein [Pseudohyphozyma bogoriensis]